MFFKKYRVNQANNNDVTNENLKKSNKGDTTNDTKNKNTDFKYIIASLTKYRKGDLYKKEIDIISHQIIDNSRYIIKGLETLCFNAKKDLTTEDFDYIKKESKWAMSLS